MVQECERGTGGGAQTNLFGSADWIKAIVLVDLGYNSFTPVYHSENTVTPVTVDSRTFSNSFGR